jgi:hypothetical protein
MLQLHARAGLATTRQPRLRAGALPCRGGTRRANTTRPAATSPSAPASSATTTAADQKRRDSLVRQVRDFYSSLYDFDLPIDGYVREDVALEDDALQVELSGAQAVGGYIRWLHAGEGVDGGEPATNATIDGAPLEKAVLAGVEVVLADEIEAAAVKRTGASIHAHAGEREDVVIATWVGRFAGGSGEDAEVLGREEFFFAAADASSDPLIVRIHTARTSAK